jgi:ankyrin repeat protein
MKTVTKIFLPLFLLVLYGRAAEPEGKYYSDQEYLKLKGYAAPSNFYPDGNSGQLQLLIMCIDRGDVVVLENLLNAVPNFANVTEGGSRCSPVHWAAFKGNTNVLGVLLKHGADIKKKGTNWKISALHIARDANTAEFLLLHGADLECKEVHGQTPLMWAAKSGNSEVAECLVGHGAKLDIKDERGRTALDFADAWGHTNVVSLLLSNGASSSTNKEKKNAIYDLTLGNFSGAGAEHPFAERTLINGSPVKTKRAAPTELDK